MYEEEKERGKKLAQLTAEERKELIAQVMFGKHWREARSAMLTLMEAWGISEPPPTKTE